MKIDIQQWLDIEVVGREDDLEKHLLVNRNEFLVPLADISGSLARVLIVGGVGGWQRLATVVLAVLEDLHR